MYSLIYFPETICGNTVNTIKVPIGLNNWDVHEQVTNVLLSVLQCMQVTEKGKDLGSSMYLMILHKNVK